MTKKIISFILVLFVFASLPAAAAETKSLTKEEVIKLALKNSKEIIKLRTEVDNAQAKLREAKGGFYPTIDLNTNYTRLGEAPTQKMVVGTKDINNTDPSNPTYSPIDPAVYEEIEGPQDNYSFQISLQQPLYMGGKLWLGLEQAEKQLETAKLELKQKRREVTYQVLEQYYNVLKSEKMVDVAEQRIKQAQNFVEVAEANKEVGIFTKTDVLQAKVNKTRAQQGLLQAENGLQMAKLALKNSLSISDSVKLKLEEELTKEEVDQLTRQEAYNYALKHRVQMKLLTRQEEGLELSLQQAKNDKWRPNVNLAANYQKQGDKLEVTDGDWQVTVALNYNLFSGGRKQAKVDQLTSQLEKFAVSKQQAKEGIKLEVEQTLLSVSEAKQRIELTKLNLEKAEENLNQVKLKYEEGIVTTSDILEAQTTLREVKTDYYQAIYDYNLAAAKLNKVLGKSLGVKEGTQ